MKEPWQPYLQLGVVHNMAFPECLGGDGPQFETLQQICYDEFFEAVDVGPMNDADERRQCAALLRDCQITVTFACQPAILRNHLDLNAADFATAREVARTINAAKGSGTAQALDGRVVRVRMPGEPDERVSFLADIENLAVTLPRPAAKIVLNARTGSVVMNEAVTLGACAVAHGALSVTITSNPVISQPAPFSHNGRTVQAEQADISITTQSGSLMQMKAGAIVSDAAT